MNDLLTTVRRTTIAKSTTGVKKFLADGLSIAQPLAQIAHLAGVIRVMKGQERDRAAQFAVECGALWRFL